jgi:hypothetical protein
MRITTVTENIRRILIGFFMGPFALARRVDRAKVIR